MLGERVREIT